MSTESEPREYIWIPEWPLDGVDPEDYDAEEQSLCEQAEGDRMTQPRISRNASQWSNRTPHWPCLVDRAPFRSTVWQRGRMLDLPAMRNERDCAAAALAAFKAIVAEHGPYPFAALAEAGWGELPPGQSYTTHVHRDFQGVVVACCGTAAWVR